jgi:hypothetical protein
LFSVVGDIRLYLDKLSSEVLLTTSILQWHLQLGLRDSSVAKLSVLGFQLSNLGIGLSQKLLDLYYSDRGVRSLGSGSGTGITGVGTGGRHGDIL